jgi:hypothetical protein
MARDSATLGLLGDRVPLPEFVAAMTRFRALIEALSAEVAKEAKIDWVVDDLEIGSAIVAVRGEAADTAAVERVVDAYADCGHRLASHQPLPFARKAIDAAEGLVLLLNGNVEAIQFETPASDWIVRARVPDNIVTLPFPNPLDVPVDAYGAVEGRIQTVSNRRGLRFTLYDAVGDRAVMCYLDEEKAELIRNAWGRRAIIEGWVSRDPLTGRPLSIRRITAITELEDRSPGSYRDARGVLPLAPGGMLPEDAIRRVRDA